MSWARIKAKIFKEIQDKIDLIDEDGNPRQWVIDGIRFWWKQLLVFMVVACVLTLLTIAAFNGTVADNFAKVIGAIKALIPGGWL